MVKQVPVLYISGPFSATDLLHGVEQNILTASKCALEAWGKGWGVICPHKNTQGFQHTDLPYEVWMDGDLAFIDRMNPEKGDALLMLVGWSSSKGARLEHDFALEKGLRVYYESEGIPEVKA